MGVLEKLSRKSGVIVGDDVLHLFEYAQEKVFAIPAIVSTFRSRVIPPPRLSSLVSGFADDVFYY